MTPYHCKKCKREWESPADLMGVPKCEQCKSYGTEGPLPGSKRIEHSNYLRELADKLMHVPVVHGVDQGDVDKLIEIADEMMS